MYGFRRDARSGVNLNDKTNKDLYYDSWITIGEKQNLKVYPIPYGPNCPDWENGYDDNSCDIFATRWGYTDFNTNEYDIPPEKGELILSEIETSPNPWGISNEDGKDILLAQLTIQLDQRDGGHSEKIMNFGLVDILLRGRCLIL